MAGKIKLNLDPNEPLVVRDTVKVPTASGPLSIEFEFVYRNREQYADLVDMHAKRAKAALEEVKKEAEEAKASGADQQPGSYYARRAAERDVQAIKDVAKGWNVDADWSDENLLNFFVKHQGAGNAIADHYSKLMVEGRLGNSAQ